MPLIEPLATLTPMLHRLRNHLRVLAGVVLVAVSSLGAWSTVAHGLDCHDTDGAPVFVAHDASAHAFRGAALPGPERPVHCVLCHLSRVVGPGVQSVATVPAVAAGALSAPTAAGAVPRLVAAAQPPLRAPPSATPLDVVA